jgi:hypothetical protein
MCDDDVHDGASDGEKGNVRRISVSAVGGMLGADAVAAVGSAVSTLGASVGAAASSPVVVERTI